MDLTQNQDIDNAGEAATAPAVDILCKEVFPQPEDGASRLKAVETEGDVAAGFEVVVKKEVDEKAISSLPPAPKWWRPGAPILCCDGWQSGDHTSLKCGNRGIYSHAICSSACSFDEFFYFSLCIYKLYSQKQATQCMQTKAACKPWLHANHGCMQTMEDPHLSP